MTPAGARGSGRAGWRKLAAELRLEPTPPLQAVLRLLIARRGYERALAEVGRALEQATEAVRQRFAASLPFLLAGVTIVDPATTYIDPKSSIGRMTVVHPNTTISVSRIGAKCDIGPNAIIADSQIGKGCRVIASVLEGARVGAGVDVGPFSHLRPGSRLDAGVHVGNFVEVKKSRLGRDSRVGHFSYVGDASVGAEVNIGAGTITCNFDGVRKNKTIIEDGALIGSDTMLVAPVRVGRGASTGAGSVVISDVPPGALVVGAPSRKVAKRLASGRKKVPKARG